ncbi:MAG: DNA repair exonuclease [Candidatus Atribacteria bacterium]|nr:DNA repair exonuclease [Candidatus Atribacteria bacterium]
MVKRKITILHTADWHLGLVSWTSLSGVERLKEQEECLESMIDTARREKVDAIIHAGDLFHHYHQPSRDAIRLAMDTMLRMKEIAPFIWVIGNHDWYAMDALKGALPKGISVVRDFTPFRLNDLPIRIFPLPYLSLARFLGSLGGESIQDAGQERLRGVMRDWERELNPDCWNILVAHLSVEDLARHYAEANETREIFLKPADIPPGIDYAAFGHLHALIPYTKCPFPLYYPSSLVLDSFLREKQDAGFLLVTLEEGRMASVHPCFFEKSNLITMEVSESTSISLLREEISQRADRPRNFIRVNVHGKVTNPEFFSEIKELSGVNWQVVAVEIVRERGKSQGEEIYPEVTSETIPVLFTSFCQENQLSPEVVSLFHEYYHRALTTGQGNEAE